jgi:hypothetical protein
MLPIKVRSMRIACTEILNENGTFQGKKWDFSEFMSPIKVESMDEKLRKACRNSERKWDFSGGGKELFGICAANKGQVDGRKVAQSLQKF